MTREEMLKQLKCEDEMRSGPRPKEMVLKMRDTKYGQWLGCIVSSHTGRPAFTIREDLPSGGSTSLYFWMERSQARRVRDWLTLQLKKRPRGKGRRKV